MLRREFTTGIGATAMWPFAARAQQQALPLIGAIWPGGPRPTRLGMWAQAAFLQGLTETGHADGRNVTIEHRWFEAQNDRVPAIVSDLVARRAAVIVINGTAAVLAAKAATQAIPIVFRIGGEPVAIGIVPNLSRPGGNITGITMLGTDLAAKRLELLRGLLPAGVAVALLVNPTNANAARETEEIQAAARLLGIRVLILSASSPSDIEVAFASMARQDVDGLVTAADPLMFQQHDRIIALVARRALPAIYSDRIFVEDGGLMSYGTALSDAEHLAGIYTGRILRGEKPADLPVQRSTKIEFLLNLKTAKALGLTIPRMLLARADEVIE